MCTARRQEIGEVNWIINGRNKLQFSFLTKYYSSFKNKVRSRQSHSVFHFHTALSNVVQIDTYKLFATKWCNACFTLVLLKKDKKECTPELTWQLFESMQSCKLVCSPCLYLFFRNMRLHLLISGNGGAFKRPSSSPKSLVFSSAIVSPQMAILIIPLCNYMQPPPQTHTK